MTRDSTLLEALLQHLTEAGYSHDYTTMLDPAKWVTKWVLITKQADRIDWPDRRRQLTLGSLFVEEKTGRIVYARRRHVGLPDLNLADPQSIDLLLQDLDQVVQEIIAGRANDPIELVRK